jgi:hypothetical protein
MNKSISLENLNLLILNDKIDAYINANSLQPIEANAHLMNVVLRHKVHHFPVGIPFIAAVKKCANGKEVVFSLNRSKISAIADVDILNQTNVGGTFKVGGVTYTQKDTLNGYPRYQPKTKKPC